MPASFPSYALLMFDGLEEQPQNAVLRTDMEAGPPKQAKLQTRVMIQRPVQYILPTNANYQSFKTFVQTTLNMGADWFDWTDPADGAVKQGRIIGGYGGVRLKPTRKDHGRWIASFQLETWA